MTQAGEREGITGECVDRFYMERGPCCAGCDWWMFHNSVAGECRRSAPVSGAESIGLLGITYTSAPLQAGHVMTLREHHCGEFKDSFDWTTLPLAYLRRIGYQQRAQAQQKGPAP